MMCCIQEPGLGFGSRELKAGNWKYVLRQERRVGGLGGGWRLGMVDGGWRSVAKQSCEEVRKARGWDSEGM